MARRRNGALIHTAQGKASVWHRKELAFLDTRLSVPVSYLINTTHPSGDAEIDLSRKDELRYPSRSNGERFSIDWLIQSQRGDNPNLIKIGGGAVRIACVPPIGVRDEQRPYTDMLFLGGELDITLVVDETSGLENPILGMGKVVGLTIVTQKEKYPVWAPPTANGSSPTI